MAHALAACLVLLGAALSGCAGAPPRPGLTDGLLDDSRFVISAAPHAAADVFARSDAMKHYLRDDMAALLRQRGPQWGLIEALRDRAQLKLDYDAEFTRSAAQAFEARSGNCLALVIMTAALAQELGLPVRFQTVLVPQSWSRTGDLTLRSGHVNLTIGPHPRQPPSRDHQSGGVTIDFLPSEQADRLRTRAIDEDTVVAMYMNNRAVETLARGRLDEAYGWVRDAVRQQPAFLPAYNTLGVVYQRHGDLDLAERAFRQLLVHAPDNTEALANLAQLLDRAGRSSESAALWQRLAVLDPHPPFHAYDLGRAAMARGDFRAARELFLRELARDPYYPEFHYWLALADHRLGDDAQARKHLALAAEHSSPHGADRQRYEAKLAWLRAQQ